MASKADIKMMHGFMSVGSRPHLQLHLTRMVVGTTVHRGDSSKGRMQSPTLIAGSLHAARPTENNSLAANQ